MRICILDSITKVVENIIEIDDPANFVPYKSGIELSTRHDGQIGWQLVDGEWVTGIPERTDEYYARGVRRIRDYKLLQSDKYLLPDFPITNEKRNEWESYRQNLRNITDQPGFPRNVVWPVKPE